MKLAKKLTALLCTVVIAVSTLSTPVYAETTSYGNTSADLSYYGFSVDTVTYGKTCCAVKSTNYLYSSSSGDRVINQTTRVFICRENGTYKDVVLTHVELDPRTYRATSSGGEILKYKAYPESLTVTCTFPTNVEYKTSSPKTQTVSKSYDVGVSLSGKELGIAGSMAVDADALTIKNQSSQSDNMYKIFYDFKPGLTGYSSLLQDYLYNTTEHIGMAAVTAGNKNYTFKMTFTTNTGYTYGVFIYNGDSCTKLTKPRTITTSFQ